MGCGAKPGRFRAEPIQPTTMSGNKSKIPAALRASFLHEEDFEDQQLNEPPEEEDEKVGVDYEKLCGNLEDTDHAQPRDGKELGSSSDFNTAKNATSTSNGQSQIEAHRTSAESFKVMCKSFRVTSPHQMASMAASGVKDRFRESLSESLLKDYERRDCIAPFNTKEIVLGKKLGSGEFSHVYLINAFRLDNELLGDAVISEEDMETRNYMKGREKYRDTKKASYALKHLRPELLDKYQPSEYAQFASDLVQEAEFLSVLQHPNIIKLRGSSDEDYLGFVKGPKGYFLIIDRLDEVLTNRIVKWKKVVSGKGSLLKSITRRNSDVSDSSKDENNLLEERLEVLLQIAAAFVYLHEKNIIFRDLKPDNVGFDVRGDVKIFDFGLSRIMPSNCDTYEEVFEMSGAGSPRYMAPEVMGEQPKYNLKADVYTYSILMWEVLALKRPYAFARSMAELIDYVGAYYKLSIEFHSSPTHPASIPILSCHQCMRMDAPRLIRSGHTKSETCFKCVLQFRQMKGL